MSRGVAMTFAGCALLFAWGVHGVGDWALPAAAILAFAGWRADVRARRAEEAAALRRLGMRRVRIGDIDFYVVDGER